jgi:hypothetical protein
MTDAPLPLKGWGRRRDGTGREGKGRKGGRMRMEREELGGGGAGTHT